MKPVKVLFLAANPSDATHLALDEECRQIEARIRESEYRDRFVLQSHWAVRPDDLISLLLREQPEIVHFSGHGSPADEIILAGDDGTGHPVPKDALVELFRVLKDNVRVVFLNACYARPQAEAITQVVDFAIGMNTAIGDVAAIKLSAAFYLAIGHGRSIQEAFDLGRTALQLSRTPDYATPELLVRDGVNPSDVRLLGNDPSQLRDCHEITIPFTFACVYIVTHGRRERDSMPA
jgi:hypothetical protein